MVLKLLQLPPELNKDVINRATQTIKTAENNLNGQSKLAEAKSDGNQSIEHLQGLTQSQKINNMI